MTTLKTTKAESEPPIDAVITWVNGSDPEFVKVLHKYRPPKKGEANRFADFVKGLKFTD